MLTKSRTTSTNIYFLVLYKNQPCPFDSSILERQVFQEKEIQCDTSKTWLRAISLGERSRNGTLCYWPKCICEQEAGQKIKARETFVVF